MGEIIQCIKERKVCSLYIYAHNNKNMTSLQFFQSLINLRNATTKTNKKKRINKTARHVAIKRNRKEKTVSENHRCLVAANLVDAISIQSPNAVSKPSNGV